MNGRERLFTKEFLVFNGLLFVACGTAALFFNFHGYLKTLPIDPAWFGFILGADGLAGLVAQPLISPFIVRRNARFFVLAGASGLVLALVAYAFATTTGLVVVVRLVHGLFYVLFISAATAALVFSIPPGQSGRAFGVISVIRLLPFAMIPPLLDRAEMGAGHFVEVLRYAAVALLASTGLLLMIRGEGALSGAREGGDGRIPFRGLAANLKARNILVLLLIHALLSACYAMVFFYLKGFGTVAGLTNPGVFFGVATVTMILVRLFGAHLFDRVDKRAVSAATLLFMACSYGLITLAPRIGLVLPGCLTGLSWGISFPVLGSLLFDLSQPEYRAVNTNFGFVMVQAGFFGGPLIGNAVLGLYGYNGLFFSCAGLSLVAAVLLGALRTTNKGAYS